MFGGSPLDQYLQGAEESEQSAAFDDVNHRSNSDKPSTPAIGETSPSWSRSRVSALPASVLSEGPVYLDSTANLSSAVDAHEALRGSSKRNSTNQITTSNSHDGEPIRPLHHATHGQAANSSSSASTESRRQSPDLLKPKTYASVRSDDGSTNLSERFKYAICSSFLLTPSLSISLYESTQTFPLQPTSANEGINNLRSRVRANGHRASPKSIHRQCYVEPLDASAGISRHFSSPTSTADVRLPRLDAYGRKARNAALLSALFLIPPITKTWQLCFSTVLLIACLTWGFIHALGLSSMDDRIHFTLSHQPSAASKAATISLRSLSTSNELSEAEKGALSHSILRDTSSLIRAAQHFDITINKAISAIQEVEIVSRGYKLTHPLPPISRIEAATNQPSGWSNIASPSRQRRSMVAPASFVPATSKLGRSLSGGGSGAPTIKRHTQRPLSLTLSSGQASPMDRASGRASPAMGSEAGELDLTQRLLSEQNTVASTAGRTPPPRLSELRKGVVKALEEVGAACASSNASLQVLADSEELALLQDLYALEESQQDEVDEGDASHAWTNGDTSALFEGSPDLDRDRKAWMSTTPRNFGSNVRAMDAPHVSDLSWRPDASPRMGSMGPRKRLSLVSDGGSVLDRQPRTTSSLSRRSSLVLEAGNVSAYRSPRLNYVSDKSATPSGPNESAAAKRLSYMSNSSAATGSHDTRSPLVRNPSIVSSTFDHAHSSAQTYSAATSPHSRATKRSSILGPNSIFAHLDPSIPASIHAESTDPLSLLSIKAKFEAMHKARRRWLCHLMALRLTMIGEIPLLDGTSLPADEYWTAARSAIVSLRSKFHAEDQTVTDIVAKEMGEGLFVDSNAAPPSTQADNAVRPESRDALLAVPIGDVSTSSLVGHPGLEDRFHAMMLSLRSLQSKIRVCAEDIRVKAPPGLHGIDVPIEQVPSDGGDDAASVVRLEKTLDSMRDDLLSLSAEWEATSKLVHKEKRRSPSPNTSIDIEADVAKANAARDLQSPSEAEEDAAATPFEEKRTQMTAGDDQSQELEHLDLSDNEDDSDLAELLLRSTSPHSLPPPGLEQVFESIAGIAGLSGLGGDGKKASRAERIETARRQRQLDEEKKASEKAAHRHTMDPSSMMSELSDVIQSRKAERTQRHQSALLNASASDGFAPEPASAQPHDQPALALGSPLDLGSAGREGVFGASHTFSDTQPLPRRSLSSLDLARARALQSLESRSPSVASSSASNSFDSGDESQPRLSEEFSFEPTALESVPEDEAGSAATAPSESPSANWESTSRKSTPKASCAPLSSSAFGEAILGPDSPFDLGAQVAAYARRKRAAKAQAAAMEASGSQSSMSSLSSQISSEVSSQAE